MSFSDDLIARELGASDAELGIFSPTTYRVFIRDRSLRIIDQLDDWTSLRLVRRFNDTGTFELVVSRSSPLAQSLVKGGGIIIRRRIGQSGDPVTVFSGRIERSYSRTARTLTVSGFDDNVYLETPARPTPSLATAPYPDEYDVATGVASSIMFRLVNLNIGPDAPVEWRVPGLVMATDPTIGGIVTTRARFDSLRTQLSAVSVTPTAGGLGWEIIQSDTADATLEFRVYQPRDLSASALFSVELGSVQDFEDTWTAPWGNYFIVAGGDGLGGDRPIVEGGDAASIDDIGRRKAVFVDARGVTDASELNQKLAEAIAGAVASRKTTITPFEIPSLIYGVDYELGDLVAYTVRDPVTTGTDTYTDLIREIDLDLNPSRGAVVVPMIGQAGSTNDDQTAQYIASVQERLSNIERNWDIPDDSIIPAMLTPGLAVASLGYTPVNRAGDTMTDRLTLSKSIPPGQNWDGLVIDNPNPGSVISSLIRFTVNGASSMIGGIRGLYQFAVLDDLGNVLGGMDATNQWVRDGHLVWDAGNAPASADVHSVQGKIPGAVAGNLAILDSSARVQDSEALQGKVPGATSGDLAVLDSSARVQDSEELQGKVPGSAAGNLAILDSNARARDAALLLGLAAGNLTGQIPVSNGTRNVNDNADMVDSAHASATPAAGTIPIANGSGLLDSGWLPAIFALLSGATFTGDVLFNTNNSHDIGSTSAGPRSIYFGTSLIGKGGEAVQKSVQAASSGTDQLLGFSFASHSPIVSISLSVGEWVVHASWLFSSIGDSGTNARGKLHIVSGSATITDGSTAALVPFTAAGYFYPANASWKVVVTAPAVIDAQAMIDGGGGLSTALAGYTRLVAKYSGNP